MVASDIWLIGDDVACRTAQRWAQKCASAVAIKTVAASDLAQRVSEPFAGPRGSEPWLISMNSTAIIRRPVLRRFDGRAVNIHPGRLPDFGGLYAVQWAIRLGESSTAATAHFMTETLDAGDVIYVTPVPIGPHDTGLTAWLRCVRAQVELLKRLLTEVAAGCELPRSSQDPSLRRVFKAADALGDQLPKHLHAIEAERWVRAGNYRPLSSPTYRPTLVIRNPRLTLWLDEVAVADHGAALDLGPGEARVVDGKLIVGCAAGSALLLKRARVEASAGLPSEWSLALDNLTLASMIQGAGELGCRLCCAGWENHHGELPTCESTFIQLQIQHLPGECGSEPPVQFVHEGYNRLHGQKRVAGKRPLTPARIERGAGGDRR